MIRGPALHAHASAGDALQHDLGRHVEVGHDVEGVVAEGDVELDRLSLRAREPVEHEAAADQGAVVGG